MENSLSGPNNVFYLQPEDDNRYSRVQVTSFGQDLLGTKAFAPYEEFWFRGADHVKVQGWAIKPYGWESGQQAKWFVFRLRSERSRY